MRIQFTSEMFNFLEFASENSIIAQIILQGEKAHLKDIGNFISAVDNSTISYLPVGKIDKAENPWVDFRVPIKVGRFIRKFFSDFANINFGISDSEIEKFVNIYKSYFTRDLSKLKIVEGDDIKKYYLQENYHKSNGNCIGSLWNSCMRQRERNKYLDLYSLNPDDCKMLVYFDDNGKVRARALLWENVNSHKNEGSIKLMDRIYTVYDHDVDFFTDWAKENGYITKAYQNARTEFLFRVDGKVVELQLYVILKKHLLSYAPYLDTFKYYNLKLGRFSSSQNFNYSYTLIQSDGNYEREPEPDEYYDEDEN